MQNMKKNIFLLGFVFVIANSCVYCQSAKSSQNNPPQIQSEEKKREETDQRLKLVNAAIQYLGTPYLYKSNSKKGMDCSGLVYQSAREALNLTLPRSASAIAAVANKLPDGTEPEIGDLLFFNTAGGISHIAIYIGEKKFIHAASAGPRTGVIISSLEEKYWAQCFLFFASIFE